MSVSERVNIDRELDALFEGRRLEDPYPIWTELREHAPVHPHALSPTVVVSRYDDIKSVMADRRRYSAQVNISGSRLESAVAGFSPAGAAIWQEMAGNQALQLISSDQESHDRLRAIMHRYFTPRTIGAMEESIEGYVDEIFNAVAGEETVDLKAMFADLASRVIVGIVGVPEADRAQLVRWANTRARWLQTSDEERVRQAHAAMQEFKRYVDEVILAKHRREPGSNPLVSALMSAQGDDNLTAQELTENIAMLLSAGIETTTILFSTGVAELLQHRDQWDYLCADPARVPLAIEELLRYVSPAQWSMRVAREDFAWEGTHVGAGETVILALAAGNRDRRVFDDPDVLDVTREGPAHLGLGFGPKFCLGASTIRMDARLGLQALVRRFPDARLAVQPSELDWSGSNPMLRSMTQVPVCLGQDAGA